MSWVTQTNINMDCLWNPCYQLLHFSYSLLSYETSLQSSDLSCKHRKRAKEITVGFSQLSLLKMANNKRPAFLSLTVDRGKWSASYPSLLIPWEGTGGWVSPKTHLNILDKRNISCICQQQNDSLVIQCTAQSLY